MDTHGHRHTHGHRDTDRQTDRQTHTHSHRYIDTHMVVLSHLARLLLYWELELGTNRVWYTDFHPAYFGDDT